jgi:hypothetical protein
MQQNMLHLAGGLEQLLEVLDRVSFLPLPSAPIRPLKNGPILVYMRIIKSQKPWYKARRIYPL